MGVARAIEGYAEAAAAGGVDAIYIATPPSEHAAHALLCIEAGIPVLVEKPFATNAAEALTDRRCRSGEIGVRHGSDVDAFPSRRAGAERQAGRRHYWRASAGRRQLRHLESADPANGSFDPALGGGAIAHLGVYPLSLAQWLFGSPTLMQAMGVGATGVDEDAAFQLHFPAA